ncbi:ATP-binding protein [Emticicia sp. BO119]|uniref:tetratricopeptide repeat-containing sensor histidine kinase n=1 Tax=Emticicia sp. BO119 TaxID=2757768 RepID=UPI0015F0A682|nr:ATP-binding protein [Emticicia sp. BO119]MBA4853734.1 tetratricopeptide repeat protein [Emticicia sp. BO119]
MSKLLCYLLLISLSFKGFAQNPSLDSLITKIQSLAKKSPTFERDTLIIGKLSLLTERSINLADMRANDLLDSLGHMTNKISWLKGKGLYTRALGKKKDRDGNYTEALKLYSRAIETLIKADGDPADLCYTYILTGFVLNNNGRPDKCIEYMEKALPLAKMSYNTNNLCWILDFYGDYNYYGNFGIRNYKKALSYYLQVEKLLPRATSANLKADNPHCIANCYTQLGNEHLAAHYRDKALKYAQATNNRVVIFAIYSDLAEIYENKNQFAKAIEYRKLSLEYAKKSGWMEMISRAENHIYQTYEMAGDSGNALKYMKEYKIHEDSLGRVAVNQKYAELEADYNFAKQQTRIKTLEYEALKQADEKKSLIGMGLIFSLLVGVILIAYVFWSNKQLKQINAELMQKNEEIQGALLKGQTIERKRVASELHDNISAKIASLRWRLEAINPSFQTEKEERIFNSTVEALSEVYTDVRLLSHNLLPAELELHGLAKALESMVKEINSLGKTGFSLSISTHDERFANKIEYELFSVILELSNNILRHAQAPEAFIALTQIDDKLQLVIKDNGIGISEKASKNGMGLANIRTRVASLHGEIEFVSLPEKGTEVVVKVPII